MGYNDAGPRCFSTPHAWQLGWIAVQELNSTNLPAGQVVTLTTASQAVSRQSGIRVLLDWTGPQTSERSVFVGYRTAQGGDAWLKDARFATLAVYANKVTVHMMINKDVPTSLEALLTGACRSTRLPQ